MSFREALHTEFLARRRRNARYSLRAFARSLGGKVLVPKSVLPDGDTMAVLHDPTGISFGVCAPVRRA